MPTIRNPRRGSMAVWPRKRAKRETARVRAWAFNKDAKPLGFAGYKVGMRHVFVNDNRPHSKTKGEDIFFPATIIECPPIKIFSVRFYKKTLNTYCACAQILSKNQDNEVHLPKSKKEHTFDSIKPEDFDDLKLVVHTTPKLTGFGKKKAEVFELGLGGKKEDKLKYAKEMLGKTITVSDVFAQGNQVDIHAVTKGKGIQGPVKRFGVTIRSHKSEKTIRGPGSLGAWNAQGKTMYRVAHAGQMGYHMRTEYNKLILKIDNKDINPKGGYKHYGVIKNQYIILKGSIAGPSKRLIRFNMSIRPNSKLPKDAPQVTFISTAN